MLSDRVAQYLLKFAVATRLSFQVAAAGFCEGTELSHVGDCEAGVKGEWEARFDSRHGIHSLQARCCRWEACIMVAGMHASWQVRCLGVLMLQYCR